MAIQKTLGIIKPDAVRKNVAGKIISIIEEKGLKIAGLKKVSLTERDAKKFYEVHKERPFYSELVDFMISGPVIVMVLEGDEAITKWRTIMGATNPEKADAGTIRKLFAANVQENAVHGSDAPETAAKEVAFFFAERELV